MYLQCTIVLEINVILHTFVVCYRGRPVSEAIHIPGS